MNIVDVENQNVKACLVFEHEGYEVSCSTICSPHEVRVFGEKAGYLAASIPDAIKWIEAQE